MNRSTLAKIVSPLALAAMLVACGSQPSGTEMVVHPANDTPITHIANYDMLGDTAAVTFFMWMQPPGRKPICALRRIVPTIPRAAIPICLWKRDATVTSCYFLTVICMQPSVRPLKVRVRT